MYLSAAGGGGEAVGLISLADSLTYQDKHKPRNEASSSYSQRGEGVRPPDGERDVIEIDPSHFRTFFIAPKKHNSHITVPF
jgi:hypothetical protein